jgi:hypothetical protein
MVWYSVRERASPVRGEQHHYYGSCGLNNLLQIFVKKKNLTTDILNKATYLSAIQAAGKVLTYFVRFNYSLLANMSTYSNKTFSLFRSCVNDSWLRDLFSDHVIHSIRLEILLLYYVYGCAALTHICTSDLKIYQKPCHLF